MKLDHTGTSLPHRKVLHVFVWGEYTSRAIFDEFKAKTGIEVVESNFASNEEMLAKIQGGATGYDLIIPSDYMVAVMRGLKLLTPLEGHRIPNAVNVDPGLLRKPFDPENRYSLPYTWSVTGIAYNKERVAADITSYHDLFSRTQLVQRVSILDDSREGLGVALKPLGYSINTLSDTELRVAKQRVIELKPRIREFSSTPVALLMTGDVLAAQVYANEALRLVARDPRFQFRVPTDGVVMSLDNFAIPVSAVDKDAAHLLIDFLLDPEINVRFATELQTAPVVKGGFERLPDSLRKEPVMRDFERIKAEAEMIQDVGDKISSYNRAWMEIKAAR